MRRTSLRSRQQSSYYEHIPDIENNFNTSNVLEELAVRASNSSSSLTYEHIIT